MAEDPNKRQNTSGLSFFEPLSLLVASPVSPIPSPPVIYYTIAVFDQSFCCLSPLLPSPPPPQPTG